MAQSTDNRGFASMDQDKQRNIASKGGQSVPAEERSFSKNHDLAAEAGRKGGQATRPGTNTEHSQAAPSGDNGRGGHPSGAYGGGGGNFAQDRQRAADAGRAGGQR